MPGTGRTFGAYTDHVLKHSAFTALIGQRRRPGELVGGALTRLRRQETVDPAPAMPEREALPTARSGTP